MTLHKTLGIFLAATTLIITPMTLASANEDATIIVEDETTTSPDISVTEQLQNKQNDFQKTADPKMQQDFEQGIKDVAATGVLDSALKVGDTAPDFLLPNALGGITKLSENLKNGPVVIVWYRGEWCPYCNIYISDLQKHADLFKEHNASIIAISPELPDRGMTLQSKLDIKFDVLSDVSNLVAKDYGIAYKLPSKIADYYQKGFDIHTRNADKSNTLPLSASYVINTDGKITYAFIDADYRKRAETDVLLEEVKKLNMTEQQ